MTRCCGQQIKSLEFYYRLYRFSSTITNNCYYLFLIIPSQTFHPVLLFFQLSNKGWATICVIYIETVVRVNDVDNA
ncbi:MAG: hypothetical protein WA323_03975, partial [Candidatus Nitrosopolaris sp.]